MADEPFDDLAPWPDAPLPDRHHNQPPLEDRVILDFDEAVRSRGLDRRIREITDSAGRVPEIRTREICGQVGDLILAASAVREEVEKERETLNRPLLTAQRTLKAKAEDFIAPMDGALGPLKARLDAYVAQTGTVVRGDYGARVGSRVHWAFEIVDHSQLPRSIRRHPDVLEAINKVIGKQVRGGEREIAGVRIWSETKANVR